ncbi:MAG: TetR family transcriptional regulator [Solirubrobacterales bacterium]|nr:TetR family transcriptional regulator [Solirubrobacterales bacterium]
MGVATGSEWRGAGRPAPGGPARRGRRATASPADVLAVVAEHFRTGHRVDLTDVAATLGLGRATLYRWFGSREALLGEVVAAEFEALVARQRRAVRRGGPAGLLDVFDRINRTLAHSSALRRFLEQETGAAMRLLTSSSGAVQQRAVASVQRLIEAEAQAGRYAPPADPATLAYAVVRLAEAFLYNDAAVGLRGDHARLREVQAALLGVPALGRPR